MSDKLIIPCHEPCQAYKAIKERLWPLLKSHLMAERRMVIELKPEKRSDAENRLLHLLLGHIAKTQEWAGKKRDIETWKRLLIAAWCRATNEQVEILPALDGHGVDLVYRKSSKLTRAECADLITFIQAWAAMQGIEFPPTASEIASYER